MAETMRVVSYTVVVSEELVELQEAVDLRIAQGWKPQGGIFAMTYEYKLRSEIERAFNYYQAMVFIEYD